MPKISQAKTTTFVNLSSIRRRTISNHLLPSTIQIKIYVLILLYIHKLRILLMKWLAINQKDYENYTYIQR